MSEPGFPTAQAPSALVAGKYRLTELLGRGGMGSVWAGVHTTLGTRVAVKFIDAEHVDSAEARHRFENEARAAAALRSKHVVEVYDHGVMDDGRPFIVMEFLDGEPLDRRLDRLGRLAAKDVARIVGMVCRALSKAHAVGIVHRDLKPENVFLVWDDEDGADVAKVVDFGIAKFTESMGPSSATRTGSVLGTPYYMSPEQARGLRSVDYRSDLWSVGVIAFRCITGRLPFEGEAVGDVLVKLCTAPIPVPSELVPELPPGFDAWLLRALGREPETRFQSATELARSLATVCGLTTPLTPSSGEQYALGSYSGGTPARPGHSPFAATTPSPAMTPAPALQTGAPITQTPSPITRTPRSTIVVLALAALAVVGIGAGVATKLLEKGDAGGASASPPVATRPLSPPTVAAPATATTAAPVPAPTPAPSPAETVAAAPTATTAAPATAPPVAAAPTSAVAGPLKTISTPAPVLRHPPAKPQKGKPAPPEPPAPKPVSDIGF
ncbi:MAG TPA: serine/threonine-protein kinase [Polyangiaceae bacterium]|nr:serine/threonine-protein kinase [Polyangiaceae bacterium]